MWTLSNARKRNLLRNAPFGYAWLMSGVLMICGSVRTGSVNLAALETAAHLLPVGASAVMYSAISDLPHFNPDLDRDPLPASVEELRQLIDESSALFFSTPEYAGAMPGALKNLLEWTVGGTETTGKPTGWVNPSSSLNRAANTYASLRTVLEYTDARIVDAACVNVAVPRAFIGSDGIVHDENVQSSISRAIRELTASAE